MFSTLSAASARASSFDRLDRIAIAYLALPLPIFLVGWFEWWVAMPLVGCVGYALKASWAARLDAHPRYAVTGTQLGSAIGVGCVWALLGGTDHIVFANADWHVRDAVLHDLVISPWPVGYGLFDGGESLLRAPLAFYLPAALVGKVLGLADAHIALALWTAMGASLFLLQVLSLVSPRRGAMLMVAAIVIGFSGMDIVGNLLNDGPRFRSDWDITTHLEWWAGKFQYSSMTTQLFWVPNHALGGWLSIGLLCRNKGSDALGTVLPMVVVIVAVWSPLTAIGLVPFVLAELIAGLREKMSTMMASAGPWAAAMAVGVVVALYLGMDTGNIPRGIAIDEIGDSPVMDLLQQAQFFLLEVGFIGAAILALRCSFEIALALAVLALLPLVRLGPGNDIVMRASIPSLAMLSIGACVVLVGPHPNKAAVRNKIFLLCLLLVGSMTPIAEIARALLLPAWPINMSSTLISADCGGFPAHYVARIRAGVINRLLRHANPLAIGALGPAACGNPAYELTHREGSPPRQSSNSRKKIIHPFKSGNP